MDPGEGREAFWREGYMFVPGYFTEPMATLTARYALMQCRNRPQPEVDGDVPAQVPGAHSVYADPLAESILDLATPDVAQLVGRRLLPTYAFYRVYRAGDILRPHTDRVACEISASLCLGFRSEVPADRAARPWTLGLRTTDLDPANVEFEQAPGDLIVYQGCDCIHWRRRLAGDAETWHAQLFLHWVDADGPLAECAYDARPRLGLGGDRRDPARVERMVELQHRFDRERGGRLRDEFEALGEVLGEAFAPPGQSAQSRGDGDGNGRA
jgi:hypothetical protein